MLKQNHQDFLDTKYFGSLNGIRCLAILSVIGFHYNGNCLSFGISSFEFEQLFFRGNWGVNLFFIVSGFLITTLLLREQQHYQTISIKRFYVRRILRIFPVYYATLFIHATLIVPLIVKGNKHAEFYHNLPAYITFTSHWFTIKSNAIFVFAWTLATEEQFYLIWPQILKITKKWGAFIFIGFLIIIKQALAFQLFPSLGFLSESQNTLLHRIISKGICVPICLGVLLAFILNSKRMYEYFFIFKNRAASLFWFGIMLFCLYTPEYITPIWAFIINTSMMLFVGSCVYQEKHLLQKTFNFKLIFLVGEVSYGMYLFHIFCLYVVRKAFDFMQWESLYFEFFTALILVFILAILSYKYYESWFLSMKKKYPSRSKN